MQSFFRVEELGTGCYDTWFDSLQLVMADIFDSELDASAELVKKMPKLDWTQRESVRAGLRRSVRRQLTKYGYPPDLSEDATQLVLNQAERSNENRVV